MPPAGLYVHIEWGTWHAGAPDDQEKLLCKRPQKFRDQPRYMRMGAWPTEAFAMCGDCDRIPKKGKAAAPTISPPTEDQLTSDNLHPID